MNSYIKALKNEFELNSNPIIASQQKAYMRNQFSFFGLKTPERRKIQQPFLIKDFLPVKKDAIKIIKELWLLPQRDFQYFAQELAHKYIKQPEESDIELYEFMVVNRSWWDTVDYIANKLMGSYFLVYPEKRYEYVKKWLASNNIWLQRCAILFQLKYKEKLDKELLTHTIKSLLNSKEFFINKAIGWILREYSRTDPEWVISFTTQNKLHPLSKKEALKLLD